MRRRYHGAMNTTTPRIALGCFMLESNAHSPVATREEFAQNYLQFGDEMVLDWQSPHPRNSKCLTGFVEGMNTGAAWTPLPLMGTMVGASGPIDQAFFDEVVREMSERLQGRDAGGWRVPVSAWCRHRHR